jgi:hypothetical protein
MNIYIRGTEKRTNEKTFKKCLLEEEVTGESGEISEYE